ncbi:MAG: metallophosphoesterase [Proteobacteria bacterium]|nr:metallophosphoesterase [Pseudomonadota bacterium]MBU1583015.1 metallophosphoesterase [Pseudomonadota bacterium]MBU2454783.1 metallophosphoesterase [Pseudomonadota bacterium]MBU2627949.1 metallophosphoesterase [Pseudomonadota bacterium]
MKTTPHNLRILAVSDFVDKSLTQRVEDKTLEPVDLIISCGDLAPEYLSFLRDRLDRPLFYVKGNHDIRYSLSNPMGCENIHAKIVRFGSLNLLGLEGSMWYNGGINQYMDKEMNKIIRGLWFSFWRKGGVHMVVTHAPPRKIHDAEDRCHMGFESFVKLIDKRKPDYFIHGHIHKEFETQRDRITRLDTTQVINTCGYTILEV